MKPTPGDVHVNRPLTNISLAFLQNDENFVATKVFPNIAVQSKSDVYFTYDRGEFNRDEMKERAPSTESAGGGWTLSTDNYSAKRYAFHKDIDDELRANADAPLNLDREATEYVTGKAKLKREKTFVTKFFSAGVWTTDITGVSTSPNAGEAMHWSDAASIPIVNVRTARATILESTGQDPNTLVLGYKVWQALQDHPEIIDRVKYSGGVSNDRPAQVTIKALSQLFEVDRILVMKAVENTANEGAANVHAFIGGKHAMLCYSAPSPGIMTPSAGYTFSWTGYLGATNEGSRIKRFRLERITSDRIEIEMAFDMKKVAADLGYFWDGIVP